MRSDKWTVKKKIVGIYKITCLKNNNVYVGQSSNINYRFYCYRRLHCKQQPKLYKSLLDYGISNHKFEVIHQCSIDKLNDQEIYHIDLFKSFNSEHGMNLTKGGQIGEIAMSEATKKKLSISLTGRKLSEEHKQKIRDSVKLRRLDFYTNKKRRSGIIWNKGLTADTSDSVRRMRDKLIGRKATPETKARMVATRTLKALKYTILVA